ncbi:MAG: dipeptidase PepV [bacterium]
MPKDPIVAQLHQWIDDHRDEMIKTLQEAVRIPSVQSEPQNNAPFGLELKHMLDFTLDLGEKWGFRVKNVDGYAGHAEFGEGEEMVMSLGHLDVVPVGVGWKHEPFGGEIEGDYIYARGVGDDKGPTYAAFFAARALKELGVPLKRRIRVVFGCNEESGFGCVHHYFKKEPAPTYGFAPDAGWPLVYAEKGISNLTIEKEVNFTHTLRIITAKGGERPNMVPDSASATLTGNSLQAAISILDDYWDKNVSYKLINGELVIYTAGKSCHGSHPWGGDNAVTRLLRVLTELPFEDKKWINFLLEASDPAGMYLGYNGQDKVSGTLSNNLGVFELDKDKVTATFNIRYPVTWKGKKVQRMCAKALDNAGFTVANFTDSKPLHAPLDREPVKTLLEVYREETGDMKEPGTMGGGTYARAVPNTVSVGAGFEGDGPPHESDERYAITSYLKCAKIYAHMLYALATK